MSAPHMTYGADKLRNRFYIQERMYNQFPAGASFGREGSAETAHIVRLTGSVAFVPNSWCSLCQRASMARNSYICSTRQKKEVALRFSGVRA